MVERWMERNEVYIDAEILRAIPTVDTAPVVHGHWIHNKKGEVHCSECNALTCVGTDLKEMTDGINFCYNCGAKMDKNSKEN